LDSLTGLSPALEMRHTGNRIGGSNPSLSASTIKSITYKDRFQAFSGIFQWASSIVDVRRMSCSYIYGPSKFPGTSPNVGGSNSIPICSEPHTT
jgi:hypothetical protein